MRVPTLALILGGLAAVGCTYGYKIDVVAQGPDIVFESEEENCPWQIQVWVERNTERKTPMWRAEPKQEEACLNPYPITYGVVPAGYKETIRAEPLKEGVAYRVEVSEPGGSGVARFKFRRVLIVEEAERSS